MESMKYDKRLLSEIVLFLTYIKQHKKTSKMLVSFIYILFTYVNKANNIRQ